MEYRIEKDSIGEKQVPVDAYYGVQSMRGCENFHITGQRMQPEFINSMANNTPDNYVFTVDLAAQNSIIVVKTDGNAKERKVYLHSQIAF